MKRKALTQCNRLSLQSDSGECIEKYYGELIHAANEKLRRKLINYDEWHNQIKQAGSWLAAAVDREPKGQVSGPKRG